MCYYTVTIPFNQKIINVKTDLYCLALLTNKYTEVCVLVHFSPKHVMSWNRYTYSTSAYLISILRGHSCVFCRNCRKEKKWMSNHTED